MFVRYLVTEALKLRRSLVMLLALCAPLLVTVTCILVALRLQSGTVPMAKYGQAGAALWTVAMLPLSVTALSVLLSHMEHSARSWDHMMILPGARPRLFLAKALILFGIVVAMNVWLWLSLRIGAWLLEAIMPVDGPFATFHVAHILAIAACASVMMIILQLWLALRTRSFVPPLALGIVGTFIAFVAANSWEGGYFPWLLPLATLANDPVTAERALWIGSVGGVILAGAMLLDLSRRDFT
jgi:ABC-2 type transport system permease protein